MGVQPCAFGSSGKVVPTRTIPYLTIVCAIAIVFASVPVRAGHASPIGIESRPTTDIDADWERSGCAANAHYDCLNEGYASPDGNATYVASFSTGPSEKVGFGNITESDIQDAFGWAIVDYSVFAVSVYWVARANSSFAPVYNVTLHSTADIVCDYDYRSSALSQAYVTLSADFTDCDGTEWTLTMFNDATVSFIWLGGSEMALTTVSLTVNIHNDTVPVVPGTLYRFGGAIWFVLFGTFIGLLIAIAWTVEKRRRR